MANFVITVDEYTNLPPSAVGDGAETTNHATDIVFSRVMFTTNTVPPYSDPEGDAALNLKITSLPSSGKLYDNAVEITITPHVISFADIDLNKLTYSPDATDLTAHGTSFLFEISDAGSGTYIP